MFFLSIRALELDAEFDGQAVVGVVLLVTAFVVPDGGLLLSYNSEISTLHAVAQRGIDGQFVCQPHSAAQRGVEHQSIGFIAQSVT